MYPICPSTGGRPTSRPVTPYYSIEHPEYWNMLYESISLEYCAPAQEIVQFCAQFGVTASIFEAILPHSQWAPHGADLELDRSSTPGFKETQEQDRQHRYDS